MTVPPSGRWRTRVAKWRDSLVIRLPEGVIETMGLKDNDEIELCVEERTLGIVGDRDRELALERILTLRRQLPADWKFDRDEANAR